MSLFRDSHISDGCFASCRGFLGYQYSFKLSIAQEGQSSPVIPMDGSFSASSEGVPATPHDQAVGLPSAIGSGFPPSPCH